MPTPTIPGGHGLPPGADDRLEHELLDPLHAVGGDAHLQEAHVLGARALRHALDVQAVPVRDELPVHDRQPVAVFGPVFSRVIVWTAFERSGCSRVARSVPIFSAS
jgi:hypothetical protein